jgi:hypothetical protein
MSKRKNRDRNLKMVSMRQPRDWDEKAEIMADAKRISKTGLFFGHVETAWEHFKADEIKKARLKEA